MTVFGGNGGEGTDANKKEHFTGVKKFRHIMIVGLVVVFSERVRL